MALDWNAKLEAFSWTWWTMRFDGKRWSKPVRTNRFNFVLFPHVAFELINPETFKVVLYER